MPMCRAPGYPCSAVPAGIAGLLVRRMRCDGENGGASVAKRPAAARRRVYIVDRDLALCEALARTFVSFGYDVRAVNGVEALAGEPYDDAACCLLLDVSLGDRSAFALQERLRADDAIVEVVFMTADADVAMAVAAMKSGAVDFLTKPLRVSEVLPAVDAALQRSTLRLEARQRSAQWGERMSRLTPREHEVFMLVLRGRRNKQIADLLGSQESTVKVHRSRLMRKLEVRTLADLLRIGAGVTPAARPRDAADGPGGEVWRARRHAAAGAASSRERRRTQTRQSD